MRLGYACIFCPFVTYIWLMSQYGESIAFILYLNHSTSNDLDDRVRVRLLGREPVVRDEVAHRQPVLIVVVANDELAVCVGEIFRPYRAIIAAAVPLLGRTQGALARQERPIPEPPFPWLRGEPGAAELPVIILRTGGAFRGPVSVSARASCTSVPKTKDTDRSDHDDDG